MLGGAPHAFSRRRRSATLPVIAPLNVQWEADCVVVTRGDQVVGGARWRAGALVQRTGTLSAKEWRDLEVSIAAHVVEVDQRLEAAYDARGVDVTQIDRMLALTPAERLRAFDRSRMAARALIRHAAGR